jgi:AraC family transcriptional regulator
MATMEHRSEEPAAGALTDRLLAGGDGWRVSEVICRLGPRDRPFEEQHDDVAIAVVTDGSFRYRSSDGGALLCAGSILLGNAGTCFECGHDHGTGDRCIAFHYAPAVYEELAGSVTGSATFRFQAPMLPPGKGLTSLVLDAETSSPFAMDELALRLAATVLAAAADKREPVAAPSAKDERRISNVLRYIEENADQPLDLAALAEVAIMSKYHFLRAFRRTTGGTPYKFVLGVRMRRAAIMLRTTLLAITTIAFDAGFSDLSTFSKQFRDVFGVSPGGFRKSRQ